MEQEKNNDLIEFIKGTINGKGYHKDWRDAAMHQDSFDGFPYQPVQERRRITSNPLLSCAVNFTNGLLLEFNNTEENIYIPPDVMAHTNRTVW